MKLAIRQLTEDEREAVRRAASDACRYYPNDGGTEPREAIRTAFKMIRDRVIAHGQSIFQAAGEVETDAYRYSDM